jgi:hypothetical protein
MHAPGLVEALRFAAVDGRDSAAALSEPLPQSTRPAPTMAPAAKS